MNPTIDNSKASIDSFFDRKLDKVYPTNDEFRKALESGKKLRFYMGADVTAPKLHIGHIIPFLKMQQLQKMGHEIIFLIGDFTGRIGDPTDKSATRTKLNDEEVKLNSEAFVKQIRNIFDFDDPINPPLVRYNSEWNDKLSFGDVIELASNFTVQQMVERDMFQKRISDNKPVYLHEFLYPLIQGYDSVAMEVDGEFGGSDQTFNMLAGRTLMKNYKNKEKFVITTSLLLSSDGVNKMSKSLGNCIFVDDTPEDKFGKVMAIPDSLIIHYYELLSNLSSDEIAELKKRLETENPMAIKKELGKIVVRILDGEAAAENACAYFERTVQNKELPDAMPEMTRAELSDKLVQSGALEPISAKEILTATALTPSNSDAKRLIQEGAVEFNGEKVTDPNQEVIVSELELIKAGKRKWLKIIN